MKVTGETSRTDGPQLKAVNGTLPGFEKDKEGEWKGPFTFIQAADTQLGLLTYMETGQDEWSREVALTRQAVRLANRLRPRPRFFIVCGDIVNENRDAEIRKEQVQDWQEAISELDPSIPLVCVCGNHDVGDRPTPEKVERYRRDFGDDFFVFWCGGLRCIVINSQYYEHPSLVLGEASAQEAWLDKILREDTEKATHTVVFQHIPWFTYQPDEDKTKFNLQPQLRKRMLDKFLQAGVRTVFCGHYHRNAGGFYKNLELVVTSAVGMQFGDDTSGIRVVSVTEAAIKHRYIPLSKADLICETY